MYGYLKGTVTEITSSNIILEVNNIGYLIYVANPFSYQVSNEYKIYLYNQIKEDEHLLYGFNSNSEKELFLKLISVKGLGPKMAIAIISSPLDMIYGAIEKGDIEYLKKFPKIGDKVARQIILDLKGKIVNSINDKDCELIEVLQNLGYKKEAINKVMKHIDNGLTLENKIKEALKLLVK